MLGISIEGVVIRQSLTFKLSYHLATLLKNIIIDALNDI